jgi:protein-tyrosine phosphatase
VARLRPVRRVLVLCLGNVCRSPYGAVRLAKLADSKGDLEVRSAGLMGHGNPSPDTARLVAASRGLDLEAHRSQLISPELVAWAELLVVMEPGQGKTLETELGAPPERILVLGELDPGSPTSRHIPDPLDRDQAFFQETYERMDRCLEELFRLIR